MSAVWSRVLTGVATIVVVAATVFGAAIGDWGVAAGCGACGFAVGVGWVVVRHDPASPVGPALAWSTAAIALTVAHVGPLADLPWSSGAWPLNLAGLLALMLVFPDGPLPGRVWRAVPWVFGVATVGMVVAQWGRSRSTVSSWAARLLRGWRRSRSSPCSQWRGACSSAWFHWCFAIGEAADARAGRSGG